jgi:holliday junction DNA helicase RuvA
MIGRLVGQLVTDDIDGAIILDVQGVGYEVTVPLGAVGRARQTEGRSGSGNLCLFVHTHVREDALSLFGFASENERTVFRVLLGLPGVGPKMALSILSSLPPEELTVAVQNKDLSRLTRIPGVGKKTAERLVLELKEKLPKLGLASNTQAKGPERQSGERERLIFALTNMGYKPAEADAAVKPLEERLGSEPISDLLREALAFLAR